MNTITSNYIETLLIELKAILGGDIIGVENEYTLDIQKGNTNGTISATYIDDSIAYLNFDLVCEESTDLILNSNNGGLVYFSYCTKGKCSQGFTNSEKRFNVKQFQTSIFSDPEERMVLSFKKGAEVKLSTIVVKCDKIADPTLRNGLSKVFMDNQDQNVFEYVGSYNLRISEKIQQLTSVTEKGLVRNLHRNGIIHIILALIIQQRSEDMVNIDNNLGSLNGHEMEGIKDISEFIQNYPEIPYSLTYLTKKSGLSPFKLQEGFKIMHGRTVTDFIRNVRVEVAEKLIRTTDLNISEIVYSVGLTSRSYFSKIFKEKYQCSPKTYQNHQNPLAVTA